MRRELAEQWDHKYEMKTLENMVRQRLPEFIASRP